MRKPLVAAIASPVLVLGARRHASRNEWRPDERE